MPTEDLTAHVEKTPARRMVAAIGTSLLVFLIPVLHVVWNLSAAIFGTLGAETIIAGSMMWGVYALAIIGAVIWITAHVDIVSSRQELERRSKYP